MRKLLFISFLLFNLSGYGQNHNTDSLLFIKYIIETKCITNKKLEDYKKFFENNRFDFPKIIANIDTSKCDSLKITDFRYNLLKKKIKHEPNAENILYLVKNDSNLLNIINNDKDLIDSIKEKKQLLDLLAIGEQVHILNVLDNRFSKFFKENEILNLDDWNFIDTMISQKTVQQNREMKAEHCVNYFQKHIDGELELEKINVCFKYSAFAKEKGIVFKTHLKKNNISEAVSYFNNNYTMFEPLSLPIEITIEQIIILILGAIIIGLLVYIWNILGKKNQLKKENTELKKEVERLKDILHPPGVEQEQDIHGNKPGEPPTPPRQDISAQDSLTKTLKEKKINQSPPTTLQEEKEEPDSASNSIEKINTKEKNTPLSPPPKEQNTIVQNQYYAFKTSTDEFQTLVSKKEECYFILKANNNSNNGTFTINEDKIPEMVGFKSDYLPVTIAFDRGTGIRDGQSISIIKEGVIQKIGGIWKVTKRLEYEMAK